MIDVDYLLGSTVVSVVEKVVQPTAGAEDVVHSSAVLPHLWHLEDSPSNLDDPERALNILSERRQLVRPGSNVV